MRLTLLEEPSRILCGMGKDKNADRWWRCQFPILRVYQKSGSGDRAPRLLNVESASDAAPTRMSTPYLCSLFAIAGLQASPPAE
jgi:hypothetical protein